MQADTLPNVLEDRLGNLLSERYLAYALSTITARSLPDVRDGLKPVQRRILKAMRELHLEPKHTRKKSARIVGDVMGRYHPHGDQAIYDALVRLSQTFAQRYPLVDGQGNFGNPDGDRAAAMRYTEARMTAVAYRLLEGLDENAVDARTTYDDEGTEPVVLPAAFPNLLANGASGVAVGMATNIPPHNVAELCGALHALLKNPESSMDDLLTHIPGPDFPTGGLLCEDPATMAEIYRTGRGSIRLRARWRREPLEHGRFQIVITELPYQVQKGKLVEQIARLILAGRLPLVKDIQDLSSEDMRLVIVPPSRNTDSQALMEHLFHHSELESRFAVNLNVLTEQGTTPRVLNLRQCLQAWLDHRREVMVRRAAFRLEAITRRLHILEGLLAAYLNMDQVIAIVRTADDPQAELMTALSLTLIQAEAILAMRLKALRKLEEQAIKAEHASLCQEQRTQQNLIGSPALQTKALHGELTALEKDFGPQSSQGARRTTIAGAVEAVDLKEALPSEPITVVCSRKGWVRALKGHGHDESALRFKAEDALRCCLRLTSHESVLVLTEHGVFHTLPCRKIPFGQGQPFSLMADMPAGVGIAAFLPLDDAQKLLLATCKGKGFIVEARHVRAQTKNGKQVIALDEGDAVLGARPVHQGDMVALVSRNRRLLIYPADVLPVMTRGKGVKLMGLKDGEPLADVAVFDLRDGLVCHSGQRQRTFSSGALTAFFKKRAQQGNPVPKGFPASGLFRS